MATTSPYSPQPQPGGQGLPPTPPPQVESVLPTVRVMRLYKPCMHMTPTMPYLPCSEPGLKNDGAGFAVSPFLLLPDSFGEIFVGETFSAYIAVLNGADNLIYKDISLNVRLQTTVASYELSDYRPKEGQQSGFASSLSPTQAVDVVVNHVLTEPGQHTLRVTVQYMVVLPGGRLSEVKTTKKFYRFSALEPLLIESSCSELNDKAMVQCRITNIIKVPLFIEKMSFNPSVKGGECSILVAPGPKAKAAAAAATADLAGLLDPEEEEAINALFNIDSLPLLYPNESYAFGVVTPRTPITSSSRSVGNPEVTWRLQMGESGVAKGEDVFLPAFGASIGVSDGQLLRVQCIKSPGFVTVGEDFTVVLRITNTTSRPASVKLQCRDVPVVTAVTASGATAVTRLGGSTPALMTSISTSASSAVSSNDDANAAAAASDGSPRYVAAPAYLGGLCVTGLSSFFISALGAGESVDTTVSVFALHTGLQELRNVSAIDTLSGREYPAGLLFKTFVYDKSTAATSAAAAAATSSP